MISNLYKKSLLPALALVALGFGCKPDVDDPGFSTGSANFTKYVAIGDNFTAGYSNGGVTRESQENAYPNIIARQIALAGGPATFNQPLFNGNGTGQLVLASLPANGLPVITRNNSNLEIRDFNGSYNVCSGPDSSFLLNKYSGDVTNLNNLGLPGLKMQLLRAPNLGSTANLNTPLLFNPFMERILPDNDSRRYIDLVSQSNATFFTVWLGLGDLLPYVTSGGVCANRTSKANFESAAIVLVDSLTKNGARGIIANIPELTTLGLLSASTLQEQLRRDAGDANLTLWLTFSNTGKRAQQDELILPAALAKIGTPDANGYRYGLDSLNPISNAESLNYFEVGQYNVSIVDYNATINNLVTTKFPGKVYLVDMKDFLITIKDKSGFNGVTYSNEFIRGNFFSLDGFSLTPRGNAIVANRFIDAINLNFNARIPKVDVNVFKGNELP